MKFSVVLLLQIGELLEGNFNFRGLMHLVLFVLMGAIVCGFAVFLGYKAFKPKK